MGWKRLSQMDMSLMRLIAQRARLYLGRGDLWGVLWLHMGLMHCLPALWLPGHFLLFKRLHRGYKHALVYAMLTVFYDVFLYGAVFYQALKACFFPTKVVWIYILSIVGMVALWWLWFYSYQLCHRIKGWWRVLAIFVFLCLAERGWQFLNIGIYRTTPLLVDPLFSSIMVTWPQAALLVVFALVACMSHVHLRCLVLTLLLLRTELYVSPTHNYDFSVYPEGSLVEAQGDAMSPITYQKDKDFYSSVVGLGALTGRVDKRHLVPWVESGYTSGRDSRYISDGTRYLVLICYDALFDDYLDEIRDTQGVVVVSNLTAFDQTPFLTYFVKQLWYIQLRTGLSMVSKDPVVDMYYVKTS